MVTITAVLVVIFIGIICVIVFTIWKKKKKQKELESATQKGNEFRYFLLEFQYNKIGQCIWILVILHLIIFWNLEANDHVGYDYAEFTNYDDQSHQKKVPKDNVENDLATVQNPYYAKEVETKESESNSEDKGMRNSFKENIKVTQNPYYEWFWLENKETFYHTFYHTFSSFISRLLRKYKNLINDD